MTVMFRELMHAQYLLIALRMHGWIAPDIQWREDPKFPFEVKLIMSENLVSFVQGFMTGINLVFPTDGSGRDKIRMLRD